MFHIYGFSCAVINGVLFGAKTIIQRRFNFTDMLQAIQQHNVTRLLLLPPIALQLTKSDQVLQYDLSSVKMIVCGAASISGDQIKQLGQVFNAESPPLWLQAYGMTEGPATATPLDASSDVINSGTVGQVTAGAEVKVVNLETLQTVPIGEQGEIWSRSAMVMKGYLNRPEETAKTITAEGWLRTGDIGKFDQDGFLFITDRLKELIKYKGYQVAPAELEALLLTHPQIADVGVVGRPDAEAGQLPTAFVVASPGAILLPDEVKAFVKERAAPFKQLKGGVYLVETIPKNPSGKILRRELKEML
jgi:4-coumarate--CoA ligase